ncbi:Fatty acid hydroxylase superfamily protein [Marivirga sericea]|uniref:Fatty acid hydroxylase superfamily protein n=1 Tax=Marivirga sericea TaxID=1028 RepID=A0A1X7K0R9_9BACT|nr:sterol desaturase family protein [Marivirga sericea]SMG34067.1 Fatty acid hydroxylase superfamily protein [Marivirga sericea]
MDITHEKDVKRSGTKKLFENPILEKLTRSHFSVPLSILAIISTYLAYLAFTQFNLEVTTFTILFTLGFFSWTLGEYFIHRYIFHMDDDKKWKRWVTYTFHGIHHEYPKDKDRIVMPPAGAILISSIIFGVFWLFLQEYAFALVPGFLIGYLVYAFVHYAIHAYQPPKNFLKWLWIYHSIHHYKHPDKYFGVSSPIWDFVFNTVPKKKN